MKKLMVYSHDAYGLGNIRRMLAVCQSLIETIPELSILLVTGSPVIHSLRLPDRLDYIKLPCLTRLERDHYSARFIGTTIHDAIRLRSDLILAATANYKPDLLLVDKKPLGIKGELTETFGYLKSELPDTKIVLILRDILDSPESTTGNWERNGHYTAVRCFYDAVMVLGMPEIFDPVKEYFFPASVAEKVEFCGYIRKQAGLKTRATVRAELQMSADEKLVLVTPGGGQDGYAVIRNYLTGISEHSMMRKTRSLVICGPEMPEEQKAELKLCAATQPGVVFREFTSDPMSYLAAADVVISMGGYNTVCEILSLKKQAIVIPRVRPTEEQWIRAERMSRLGLFSIIHPDQLTPQLLMNSLHDCLEAGAAPARRAPLDLNALPRIASRVEAMLFERENISVNAMQMKTDPAAEFHALFASAVQYL